MYKCKICGYETQYKSNLNKHINKKLSCKPSIEKLMIYNCRYCNKTFEHRQSKYRHQRECSHKMNNDILELRDEINELKRMIYTKPTNTNINIEKVENMNIEIVINNYGYENIDYISNDYLSKLLELPLSAIKRLVKCIHFNKNHPENHNLKITNKKLPYISLFSTNKWVLEDKKEVIENLVDNGYNIIDEHYIEVGENLTAKQRERYKKFQFNYENDDTKLKKKLLKDVELTILNN